MKDFIAQFAFGGLISLVAGNIKDPLSSKHWYVPLDDIPENIPGDLDIYFAPAMRKTAGDEKTDVLGSVALWVDYDNENKPRWTIPPTHAVFSGHGWHCYWLLDTPCLNADTIEAANKLLADDLAGDMGCWNVNRVLRVPGTMNNKNLGMPVKVEIRFTKPSLRYSIDDIFVLNKLSKTMRHKIATGDARGHRSRSERDWKILMALVNAGATDDLIFRLFDNQPCGDKHRESGSNLYLQHSLERIREKPEEDVENIAKAGDPDATVVQDAGQILVKSDGFYITYRKFTKRISTFTMDPKLLLDGSSFSNEDAIVCDVKADTYTWPDITFNRSAFTTVGKMDRATPTAAWQWLGKDDELRQLLPYLLERLKEKGLPKVAATKTLGLHKINNVWMFLGNKHTISKTDFWNGFEGPLAWLPSEIEHPNLELGISTDHNPNVLGELIPQLNDSGTIWPMIGWYTAAVLKPWLESKKYRFPILNVAGTKGSGKTTLIQKVFMPMWGQPNPNTYDAGTTRFVTLALMGSTNAIPIAFSEFRVDAVQRFLRYVLLSYDTGHDPRGTADQRTIDYPLQAPFSLDGEDLIDDPAARERIVVARLHPKAVEENSAAYEAFKAMQFSGGVPEMAGSLISRVLSSEAVWEDLLAQARTQVFEAFPNKLPDRVRNNHIVTYFGILLWCLITESSAPQAIVLSESISSVHDLVSGRSRTLCDDMIEYLANKCNSGGAMFKYAIQGDNFYFQLTPAHEDWMFSRRRTGRGSLERDAMKTQLTEAPYYVNPQVVSGVWMYGVNLVQAVDTGLDVPVKMNAREIRISL